MCEHLIVFTIDFVVPASVKAHLFFLIGRIEISEEDEVLKGGHLHFHQVNVGTGPTEQSIAVSLHKTDASKEMITLQDIIAGELTAWRRKM